MRIIWTIEARADLDEVYDFIAEDNPAAAGEVYDFIYQYTKQQLSAHSEIGQLGRVRGTRELVVPRYRRQYIVVYKVADHGIQIVAVWHGKRRWPKSFEPSR